MLPKLRVRFLCTGNSCRSQMAEGWARVLRADQLEPYSAGTTSGQVDARAAQVMHEAGVDISQQRSKHLEDLIGIDFGCVITVCDRANDNCPVFPGETRRLHVGFPDPPRLAANAASESEILGHYRRVRDQIRAFVESMPGTLDRAKTEAEA